MGFQNMINSHDVQLINSPVSPLRLLLEGIMGFSKASKSQENPDFSPELRHTVDNKTLKGPLKGRRVTFNITFSRGLQTLQYVNYSKE